MAAQGHSMTSGPGAMDLYNRHTGPQMDTGMEQGANMLREEMAARQVHARPSQAGPVSLMNERDSEMATINKENYYMGEDMPVKYDVPTPYKERFQNKQEILKAIENNGQKVIRNDTIGEDEVQYLEAMKAQAELAQFDKYVHRWIDPRKPGNMKLLMDIYPQFVARRVEQTHTDYDYAIRSQMIDQWGVNTFDDLHFLYLRDQGKIDGPSLMRRTKASDNYAAGALSPWRWAMGGDAQLGGTRLPFASALHGARPEGNDPRRWELKNDTPLSRGKNTPTLADRMYRDENRQREGNDPDMGIRSRLPGPIRV